MNVRKRLELLYAGKHELTVIAEEEIFIVHLKLELEGYKAEQKYHSNKLVYA
jgi:competence protein ComGF